MQWPTCVIAKPSQGLPERGITAEAGDFVLTCLQEAPTDILEKYAALAGIGQWNTNALSKGAVRVRNAVLGCVLYAQHLSAQFRAVSACCANRHSLYPAIYSNPQNAGRFFHAT